MIRNRLLPTVTLLVLCVGGTAHAADPEFKPTIVTASFTYDRQAATFSVAGVAAAGKTVTMSRVTVALDGELVTGEWESKSALSASAKDFRRGTDVLAAVRRNRLLLKRPKGEGDIVTAKIIKREKQRPPALRALDARGASLRLLEADAQCLGIGGVERDVEQAALRPCQRRPFRLTKSGSTPSFRPGPSVSKISSQCHRLASRLISTM